MEISEEGWLEFGARIFKALGDPKRLKILHFLREGEKCVCEIVPYLGDAQPAVSRHLKILKNCGILKFRKDGNRRLYSIADPRILKVLNSVDDELTRSLSQKLIRQIIPILER